MNTKTLLLLGALGAAGMTSAVAQTNVYSVNAVGYVNVNLPAGFSMIANPLNTTNNTLTGLFPSVPVGTTIFKWTGSTYDSSTFIGLWLPELTLNPGEGAFIQTGAPLALTFVGEVMQGSLTNQVPAGFSIRSSMVPQSAGLDVLGYPAAVGDTVFMFNRVSQGYDSSTFLGVWAPSTPTPAVGESFFLSVGSAKPWIRSFSVNN